MLETASTSAGARVPTTRVGKRRRQPFTGLPMFAPGHARSEADHEGCSSCSESHGSLTRR